MRLNPSQISIPANYVLVLPDADFKHFHIAGAESEIQVGNKDAETYASHYSVRGRVFAVPERLDFCLNGIKGNLIHAPNLSSDETMFFFRSQMVENLGYKQASVLFDVPMEVKVGDVVYFNYQEHYACFEQGRWIETEEYGEMMLMKYDNLICCHPEHDPEAVTMLNGYLLVEAISTATVFGKHVYEKAGILFADQSKEEQRIKKKKTIGFLAHSGTHVRRYMENPDNGEGPHEFIGGELILYNPKVAPPLMFGLHKADFEGRELLKIHRKDIFCILPEAWKGNLAHLASQMHLN